MARLPDGVLMQRAAAGLAHAVLRPARPGYGARVLLLVGAGQQRRRRAVRRRAAGPARGGGRGAAAGPDRAHAGGLAALRPAGGRVVDAVERGRRVPTWWWTGSSASAAGGGLRPDAAAAVAARGRGPGGRRGRALRRRRRHRASSTARTCAPTSPSPSAPTRSPTSSTRRRWPAGRCTWSTSASTCPPAGRRRRSRTPTCAALLPRPAPDAHKYTRGVVGVRAGSEQYPGAGVLCVSGAGTGLVGMVRYVGGAADLVREQHPGGRRRRGPGPGLGDRLRRRSGRRAGAGRRPRPTGYPSWSTPTALTHVTGPLDVPALLTPHAGELARMLGVERDAGRGRPAALRPRGRRAVRRRGAAQGPAHAGRRTRRRGPGHHRRAGLAGDRRRRRRARRALRVAAGRRAGPVRRRLGRAPGCTAPPRSRPAAAGRSPRPTSPRRCRAVCRDLLALTG